jgi:hypothetical protein
MKVAAATLLGLEIQVSATQMNYLKRLHFSHRDINNFREKNTLSLLEQRLSF